MVTGRDSLKPIYQVDTEEKRLPFPLTPVVDRKERMISWTSDDNKLKLHFLVNIWLEDYRTRQK